MFLNDRKAQAGGKRRVLPVLPLRDIIIFPFMSVPMIISRPKSVATLDDAANHYKREVFLAAQRDAGAGTPKPEDLQQIGVFAVMRAFLRLPDGSVRVLLEGRRRGRIVGFEIVNDICRVEAEELGEAVAASLELNALMRTTKESFEQYLKLHRGMSQEAIASILALDDPGRLADIMVAQINFKMEDRQALLEELNPSVRLDNIHRYLQSEIEIIHVERKIKSRVRKQMDKSQKEQYLNEQMQAIQRELGEKDELRNELQELEARVREKDMPDDARQRCLKEARKLRSMSPMAAEATVVRNYVDTVLGLPWNTLTEDRLDIGFAARVLDEDHHGLRRVKERVLEYLAVASLVERMKGPILCLVGPPGVGKTSLARSIARATNRNFVRVALGGVRDEAEIRGHRRTYIGAMPGKVIQALGKAGSNNPVFLLDEIDKMSTDFRGDPASALLEVLDPEQNEAFSDHYLDMDYDLSKVMFVCTANSLHGIPAPLQDRLEIIRIEGYTEQEKLAICRRHLLDKQIEANGLTQQQLAITQQALLTLIRRYTKEAGVRNLEREVAAIGRKIARRVSRLGPETRVIVTTRNLEKLLGPPRFRYGRVGESDEVGFVNGLAWTAVGGVMVPIEAAAVRGTGKTTLTGQLGTVFQESCQAAITYIRSRAARLGLKPEFYQELDLHVHVSELWGVDGPSAGISIATAVVSAVTGIPVRREVAMTGEITLRGQVRPIGGLKEKLLAAHRAGISTVIIPRDNASDLQEISRTVLEQLTVLPVESMDQVLEAALSQDRPPISDAPPDLAQA